jgi:hypothetical protein
MAKYVKKVEEIQAVQWNGVYSLIEIDKMMSGDWTFTVNRKTLKIHTNSDSGPLVAEESDYIVLEGSKIYVVPEKKFRDTYQKTTEVWIETSPWKTSTIPGITTTPFPNTWISTGTGSAVNPPKDTYTISGTGINSAKFECSDCLDLSTDTITFAQKTACSCCEPK